MNKDFTYSGYDGKGTPTEYKYEKGVFVSTDTEYWKSIYIVGKEGSRDSFGVAPISPDGEGGGLFAILAETDESGFEPNEIVILRANYDEQFIEFVRVGFADYLDEANATLKAFLEANTDEEIIGKLERLDY